MFSSLVKGNGLWDGHLEDESTLDSLLPSIHETAESRKAKLPPTDAIDISDTQNQVLKLPKTYLTRKGAILLFAAHHARKNHESEKQNKNIENSRGEGLGQVEEQIPPHQKRKLFLEFLDVFLKDQDTNKQEISRPIDQKQNNSISKHVEDQTENVFKVLSRPKSINSFYNHHETLVKRPKERPKTVPVNVLPKEAEQIKAHPRITSGKPCPPIRALGKLPCKLTRTDLEKTTNFLQLPSQENHHTRQLTTPYCSITNEMDDVTSIPNSNSEYHFERLEKASRAASSTSRYSTWWAMDDISLGYYDNDVQDDDDDDEHLECIECLSEQRSEICRTTSSDIKADILVPLKREISEPGNEVEDMDEQVKFYKGMNASSFDSDLNDPRAFKEDKLYSEKSRKSRVKSAPVLANHTSRCPRKTYSYSAGQTRPCSSLIHADTCEYKNLQTKAWQRNYSVRIPSAASYYDDNEDDITTPEDISEQPTRRNSDPFTEIGSTTLFSGPLGLKHGVTLSSNENDDDSDTLVLTQETSHIALFQGHSLGDGEDPKNDVKTNEPYAIKDEKYDDYKFENCIKNDKDTTVFKPAKKVVERNAKSDKEHIKTRKKITGNMRDEKKQELKGAKLVNTVESDFVEVQILDVISQAHQERRNKANDDEVSGNATSFIFESRSTELGEEIQKENISSDVAEVLGSVNEEYLPYEGTHVNTPQEECPVKETVLEEELDRCSDNVLASYSKDEYTIKEIPSTEDSFTTNALPPCESSQVNVKSDERSNTSETNEDKYDLTAKTLHPDIAEVQGTKTSLESNETPEIYVREVQLTSETDKLIQLAGIRESDSRVEQQNVDRMTTEPEPHYISQTKREESSMTTNMTPEKSLADSEKAEMKGSFDIQQDAVTSEKNSEGNSRKENSRNKPKQDQSSKTKDKGKGMRAEKTKGDKLDVKGVGKAENKVNEEEDKMEVKIQNKVDLSDLVVKKGNNKTTKKSKAKSPKMSRKTAPALDQIEPEPRLSMIPKVDETLIKMIENPDGGSLELSEETLNQFAPVQDFQDPDVLTSLESGKTTDAFSPSKVKKSSKKAGKKKGKAAEGNAEETRDAGEERKTKIAEDKARQDEQMKLLKEREEEQHRLMEEAKEKQRAIDEEKGKRLAQEAEARRQEEQAEQDLKEAKRKAKEEREKRREEEAERRRMEVQRKREDKRRRELEIQKREAELEKQRVDREQRMEELQAQKDRELEMERIAEEQRQEEERRRLLELDEEKRLEDARIREAEEAVQRMAREREYREQMRKIAEAQQAKLEKLEMERRKQEEEERAAIEKERIRLEEEAQMREEAELERVRELRQKEAIARIRAAHEASKRRAWALRRRAQNMERMASLRFTRQSQKMTEAFTFSYHVQIPREVWELPYDWNSKKKKKGSFRPARKRQNGGKTT
ncbi:calponin homology domain-containing protein DDB_G0272472-like [Dendronephthya gigantea]|uniref:calponin homology domain-containing protein DDB_G0272472-like n=1 Tax=Dendronephthya gigantea TaxID=151771 RepID=UPI00106B713A|nr:calponin homology domain-containing protein DDB_G0272472-like [Dendronephthya gigantea]